MELERRSGGALSKSRWQQIATSTETWRKFPEPETVVGIAAALEVTTTTVVLAAAASVGLEVRREGSEFAQLLPPGADLIGAAMRDALLHLVRAAVDDAISQQAAARPAPAPGQQALDFLAADAPSKRRNPSACERESASA